MNTQPTTTTEPTEETKAEQQCCCFEVMGDNKQCPIHGNLFHE